MRFSRAFSSSSSFIRLSSVASMPPYRCRHLYNDALLTPYSLLISSSVLPLSNSLRILAICVGLNLLFFIFYVLKLLILSTFKTYYFWGSLHDNNRHCCFLTSII